MLVANGVSQIVMESQENVQAAFERFLIINKYCKGLEKEQIATFKSELKDLEINVENSQNK